MKKTIVFAMMSLMTTQSFAASVLDAKVDSSGKNLQITVGYGGGCGEHEFTLEMGACFETYPVQCQAKLIEKTNDHCEALIRETVVIPLAKYNLDQQYFRKGSLTITGDIDWQTDKPSSATVRLP